MHAATAAAAGGGVSNLFTAVEPPISCVANRDGVRTVRCALQGFFLLAVGCGADGVGAKESYSVVAVVCFVLTPDLLLASVHRVHGGYRPVQTSLLLSEIGHVYGVVALAVFVCHKIPPELIKMAEEFQSKVDSGQARKASSGFSGKGFTFDDSEQSESQQVRAALHCSTVQGRGGL